MCRNVISISDRKKLWPVAWVTWSEAAEDSIIVTPNITIEDTSTSLKLSEVRNRVEEKRTNLGDCSVHVLRLNCLLKHVIQGNIKGEKRRRWRSKQLINDLNGKRSFVQNVEGSFAKKIFSTSRDKVWLPPVQVVEEFSYLHT